MPVADRPAARCRPWSGGERGGPLRACRAALGGGPTCWGQGPRRQQRPLPGQRAEPLVRPCLRGDSRAAHALRFGRVAAGDAHERAGEGPACDAGQ
eukprot:374295-Pyramimonas_sp.AAC.1